MRRILSLIVGVVLVAAIVPPALAQDAERHTSGATYVEIGSDTIVVGNDLVERTWARSGWATTSFIDKRTGEGVSAGSAPDFTLEIGTGSVPSTALQATSATVEEIPGGLRVDVTLTPQAGVEPAFSATRTIEIYTGIAGMRTQTTLNTLAPLVLRGYALEQANVGTDVAATLHAFRAGADWREPGWTGPRQDEDQPFPGSIGDPHAGTWRDTDTAPKGENIAGAAQWISVEDVAGHSLFMVMERNDWPSSRAAYTDGMAKLNVDYSADIVILGPIEENWHVENPRAGEAPGRHRVIEPGAPYQLESTFVGFGTDADDEPWQFYKYLSGHRLDPYDSEVTFNSNGTDDKVISDGAKDDMDFATFMSVLPKAEALGIETFILDDGWQAISGDWNPDCPDHPEPRWDGDPRSRYKPRFPDCSFEAVRNELEQRGMELGLWMSAMHFHPSSETYRAHPEYTCAPVGHATAASNILEPNSGSNDAGTGTWGPHPDLMDHVQSNIQKAITEWGVTYFKFDFLVWLDCAGLGDMYDYKESFMAMLDRLIAANPDVTFQIDETNDYRLFPFESVSRGPSWFQNGSPSPDRLLHNLWNLSPYVPAYSLGQHFLGGSQYRNYPIDTLMAVALPGHMTFFSDLRKTPDEVLTAARPWVDFYKNNRDHFTQMTYPLLADPIEKRWTALQTWDPERGRGALLAFRQESNEATQTVSLRNVPDGMTFELRAAPSGEVVETATSAELQNGIEVTIPNLNGARVLLIEPVTEPPFDPTTTLVYTGDTSVRRGRALTLAAHLSGTDGPIAGAVITFGFKGATFTATTDPRGDATVSGIKVKGAAGAYEVIATYSGSDRYSPARTTATVQIGS